MSPAPYRRNAASAAAPHREVTGLAGLVGLMCAVGLFFVVVLPARAAAGRLIILVQIPVDVGGWPAAERRAAAELISLGFEVETVALPAARAPAPRVFDFVGEWAGWAEKVATEKNALAVVSVTHGGSSVAPLVVADILDRVTGKTSSRRVGPPPGEAAPDADGAALLAVELLYASLLEIELGHPSRGAVAPPRVVETLVRDQRLAMAPARFAAHVGTSLSAPAGDLAVEPGVALGAAYSRLPWLALAADLHVGLIPVTVQSAEARARVGWLTGTMKVVATGWPRGRLAPFVGLGVGWLLVWSRGASPPEGNAGAVAPTRTDGGGTALLAAGVGIAVRLRPNLRFRLAVEPMLLATPVRVRFGGVEVARAGRGMLDAVAGLEWLWP